MEWNLGGKSPSSPLKASPVWLCLFVCLPASLYLTSHIYTSIYAHIHAYVCTYILYTHIRTHIHLYAHISIYIMTLLFWSKSQSLFYVSTFVLWWLAECIRPKDKLAVGRHERAEGVVFCWGWTVQTFPVTTTSACWHDNSSELLYKLSLTFWCTHEIIFPFSSN